MCSKIRQYKIRNDNIREFVWVVHIEEKIVENILRWFEHVDRKVVNFIAGRIDQIERRQTTKSRGIPKKIYEKN